MAVAAVAPCSSFVRLSVSSRGAAAASPAGRSSLSSIIAPVRSSGFLSTPLSISVARHSEVRRVYNKSRKTEIKTRMKKLTGTSKDTVASLGSQFSAQNGFSLRPTLRFASLKSSSSSSSGRSNAAGSLRICASSATVEENESESESKSIEAYVKSVLPGGFAAARLWGTGRRKCAIARVVLVDGTGRIIINNRTAQDYLQGNPLWLQAVKYPLASLGYESKYDTIVRTHGGGLSGQAQAILLGIARALIKANQANRDPLKKQGLLTRDSRVVERKKYGLKKARKAPQFSKR